MRISKTFLLQNNYNIATILELQNNATEEGRDKIPTLVSKAKQ